MRKKRVFALLCFTHYFFHFLFWFFYTKIFFCLLRELLWERVLTHSNINKQWIFLVFENFEIWAWYCFGKFYIYQPNHCTALGAMLFEDSACKISNYCNCSCFSKIMFNELNICSISLIYVVLNMCSLIEHNFACCTLCTTLILFYGFFKICSVRLLCRIVWNEGVGI